MMIINKLHRKLFFTIKYFQSFFEYLIDVQLQIGHHFHHVQYHVDKV